MAKVRPIKAHASSRDANGGVTDTPSEFREFETGDTLPVELGGTNATTAGAALTNLGVSAFMQTVLDDVDAATARTTLGASSGGGGGFYFSTVEIKTANYSATSADNGKLIVINGNITITLPDKDTLPDGFTMGFNSVQPNSSSLVVDSGGLLRIPFESNAEISPFGETVVVTLHPGTGSGFKYWSLISPPRMSSKDLTWASTMNFVATADQKTGMPDKIVRYTSITGASTDNYVVNLGTNSTRHSAMEFVHIVERDGTAGTKTIDFQFNGITGDVRKSFTTPFAIAINEKWIFTTFFDPTRSKAYINALKYS